MCILLKRNCTIELQCVLTGPVKSIAVDSCINGKWRMKEMGLLLLENFWADYQHFFSLRHWIFGEVTVVYLGKDEKIRLSQNRGGKMKVRKQTVNSVAHFSCAMIANMKYIFPLSVVQGQACVFPLHAFVFLLCLLYNLCINPTKQVFNLLSRELG